MYLCHPACHYAPPLPRAAWVKIPAPVAIGFYLGIAAPAPCQPRRSALQ